MSAKGWIGSAGLVLLASSTGLAAQSPVTAPVKLDVPVNTWVLLRQENAGAHRGCAIRHAPAAGTFLLWGFMDANPEFRQETPAMPLPEHDMVAFDLAEKRWRDHLPAEWTVPAGKKALYFVPRTYHGLTSGSERSLFRAPAGLPASVARPDLNIVLDQVVYHPPSKSLVYFTGGLTAAYQVQQRRWSNLAPAHSPPPVLGGSLAYDPLHNELVLFGGGHVVEKRPDGRLVGHTGTWVYSFADRDWKQLALETQPPPRMYTRLVCDSKNQVLVLFGGDSQSHYLADTWLYDLKTRRWRTAAATGGPAPRAGHFTVYDPQTGWIIIGGGFNRDELTDMWGYDVHKERWQRLAGEVPTGAYLSADLSPDQRLLLLVRNNRAPGYGRNCDVHYAARSTHAYLLAEQTAVRPDQPQVHQPLPKRPPAQSVRDFQANPVRAQTQAERLRQLPVNRWVHLSEPARIAPARSWGSATFDTDRGRILLWGGGHCSYGGSDVDAYDVAQHTWICSEATPEYPHRMWSRGVRLAGVTFAGNPWTEHGRRIYAYEPTAKKMLSVRRITLTTGYEPEGLRAFPGQPRARVDAQVKPPTSYDRYVTWAFDPASGRWAIVGPAPAGLDTLVSTRHGVLGVNVDWPARLNDAGYLLPWGPDQPEVDNAVFRFDATKKLWQRLGETQPSPQNLYEMTTLVHDSQRDRLLLHGAGQNRDELWSFDLKTNRWQNLRPQVLPAGTAPPLCNREAVYLPDQDVMLTYGPAPGKQKGPALWAYRGQDNTWRRVVSDPLPGVTPSNAAGQNRALVHDPQRGLVLLVIGTHDRGDCQVFALKYRHDRAVFNKEVK